jgi:hypothetical protein
MSQEGQKTRLLFVMRALREIGIVTVGILIAFALDAWWDGRSMAKQEQIHLRALASDFEQNAAMLKRLIELEESIASSSHELLLRAQGRAASSSESVSALVDKVFNSARYEPVMGAYEALVNSAGLTLIQDDSLRASLAQFAARARDPYAENWSNEHYFAFAREFGGLIVFGFHEGKTGADRDSEIQELLRDPAFQRHLAFRYYSERDMVREYSELQRQAEAVLAQVRTQITD